MVFKRFRVNLVLRALLLAFFIALLFFLVFQTKLFAALFITAALIIFQIYSLIHYVETTNRDLARFFQSIKYGDFTQTFKTEEMGESFSALRDTFTQVSNAFRETRAEKEEHYRYLQTVVQHVGVGLLAFQPDGEVELINNALKKLLRIPHLKNIQSLNSISPDLVTTMLNLQSRERALVKIEKDDESLHLALYSTEFKLRGKSFILVSIQNIHSELEETEIEAWQKIIRVLTHEIMNSITPISSLASTVNGLLIDSLAFSKEENESEVLEDVRQALYTIQKRSQGLMNFVGAYRNYTLVPKPKFQRFSIKDLFSRVESLMLINTQKKGIQFSSSIEPESLELTADPEMIEQVLINLMLNALQSVENRKDSVIELNSYLDTQGKIVIQVKDNGSGIQKEILDKIFVPFFSTKEGGSGIGLSLSRQIMRLHKGNISVHSRPDAFTIFTLKF